MSIAEADSPPFANDLIGLMLARGASIERLPVEALTTFEVAAELERVQARKAMDDAYEAELILALAAARPESDDPPLDRPGARRRGPGSPVPGTSEFLPEELALVLNCSRRYAAHRLFVAHVLVERMPAVWQACADGRLDWYRAGVFADVLGALSDEVIAVVVPALLPAAAGLSSGTLRRRLLAAAMAADEEFAERRRLEAERRAEVRLYPTRDGLSALATELPSPVAAAMWSVIDQAAQLARTAGDDRPIGLLRAEAHAAMVLRPGDPARPSITAQLTVFTPLSALERSDARTASATAAPAGCGAACADVSGPVPTVNGVPVTAGHIRELLIRLGALGVQAPPGGSLTAALTDDHGRLLAVAGAAELARAARGCPDHGPDADCTCSVLEPPPAAPGYGRSAGQERFLHVRDRTCRHPGCAQPAGRTDADHVVPYDCGGRTSCDNLCCLCRTHHRLKTFARGWRFVLLPDGTLRVTTPSGITRSTRPPGLHVQPALPAPAPPPPGDDPPPF